MGGSDMTKGEKTNSFRLLWEAIKASRRSMWNSLEVLAVLTVILATIFYFVEFESHREEYDYWDSLIWAFTRYIDDPGGFSTMAPLTVAGRWIATLIGIVGILIFAVPAGLIGGAFTNAIEEDQRKSHLRNIGDRLRKAFRRKQDPATMYKCVPRYISLGSLQALKNMTQNDIIDAVEQNQNFRLRNLADAAPKGTHAVDNIVVEMFPLNTAYGCCIDRGSDITIVCPTAVTEAGIGNFGYYLALIGGFNYISKEIELDVDETTSFYIISDRKKNEHLVQYLEDVKRLSAGKNHWTIFIISSETRKDADIHFLTAANANTGRTSTIIDQQYDRTAFNSVYESVSTDVKEEFNIRCDLNQLRPAGPKNASVIIGGGTDTNAFTIRIFSELLVWDTRYMALAKTLATDIALTLGESYGEKMTDQTILKESGFGY